MSETAAYKRILLKLSGEALMGAKPFGIDEAVVARIGRGYRVAEVLEFGRTLSEGAHSA